MHRDSYKQELITYELLLPEDVVSIAERSEAEWGLVIVT